MWIKHKPSELVKLFAAHPMYNPAGIREGDTISYRGTRYLCNVSKHLAFEELPCFNDLALFHQMVEDKLKSLKVTVLYNHFHCNCKVAQTLENSREFWAEFAKELETRGL